MLRSGPFLITLTDMAMHAHIMWLHTKGRNRPFWVGSLTYYNIPQNRLGGEWYALDLGNGIFSMSAYTVVKDTYLVAFSDPDADPFTVPEQMIGIILR